MVSPLLTFPSPPYRHAKSLAPKRHGCNTHGCTYDLFPTISLTGFFGRFSLSPSHSPPLPWLV